MSHSSFKINDRVRVNSSCEFKEIVWYTGIVVGELPGSEHHYLRVLIDNPPESFSHDPLLIDWEIDHIVKSKKQSGFSKFLEKHNL